MDLLEEVVESLGHTAQASSGAERLFKVCSAFGEAGRTIIGAGNPAESGPRFQETSEEALEFTYDELFTDAGLVNLNGQDLPLILDGWSTGMSTMDLFGPERES